MSFFQIVRGLVFRVMIPMSIDIGIGSLQTQLQENSCTRPLKKHKSDFNNIQKRIFFEMKLRIIFNKI